MSIAANLEKIEGRILGACLRSGRKREELNVMAVTKFQTPEIIEEAWKTGLRCFGESRVQEAVSKFTAGYSGMELHFLGNLQRNKVKLAASLFDCIQSVDRQALIPELAKALNAEPNPVSAKITSTEAVLCRYVPHRPLSLMLEFRTGEDSKSGFTSLDELFRTVDLILGCPILRIRGLMTIAPNTREESRLRFAFRQLVKVQTELERRFPVHGKADSHSWSCLSMVMSDDFETAIEEGSTMLRIGSAIFSRSELNNGEIK